MSYISKGVDEQRWQASNWVFHAVSETLLRVLNAMPGAEDLADRLEEAIEMEIGYMDASDLLASLEQQRLWTAAVNQTLAEVTSARRGGMA